jgi:hypothetical protein
MMMAAKLRFGLRGSPKLLSGSAMAAGANRDFGIATRAGFE